MPNLAAFKAEFGSTEDFGVTGSFAPIADPACMFPCLVIVAIVSKMIRASA
jgi:hypothetical protein